MLEMAHSYNAYAFLHYRAELAASRGFATRFLTLFLTFIVNRRPALSSGQITSVCKIANNPASYMHPVKIDQQIAVLWGYI